MQAPGRYRTLTYVLPAILIGMVVELYYLIAPNGFDAVTYTYDALYTTLHACFPHAASLAFIVLIVFPHLLTFALAYYVLFLFCHRFPLEKYVSTAIIKCLEQYRKLGIELGLFTYNNGYKTNVFKQLLVSTFIMLLFVAAYYLLYAYSGTSPFFFKQQLLLSQLLIATLVLQFITVLYVCKESLLPFVKSLLTESGSVYTLAIVRIVILTILYNIIITNYTNAAYWTSFPDSMRVSLPFMGWFVNNIPISPALYKTIATIGLITSVMGMVGLFTRPAIFISAVLSIYVIGVPFFYGKLMHMHIWVWFPLILAFSRCGDVLSIDYLIRRYLLKKTVTTEPRPSHRLPLLFIWLHLGIIYFFAALIKLKNCGLEWALGDSMINQIQVEWVQHYNKLPAIRIDNYPILLHIGGIGVILFELYFCFLILSAKGRIVAFFGGLAMHNIINYFMYIGFQDLQRTYISLIDWVGLKSKFLPAKKEIATVFSLKSVMQESSFKTVFFVGVFLLSINFLFGLFQIHSWPFSSYPTYSAIVPATHTYIHFDAYDSSRNKVDVYKEGEQAGFRMETFTPIEDRIAENVQNGDYAMLKTNTEKLWKIWVANVPNLSAVDSVAMYLRTAPVAPGKTTEILTDQYLLSYTPKND